MTTKNSSFSPLFAKAKTFGEKHLLLQKEPFVRSFFQSNHPLIPLFDQLTLEERTVLEIMIFLQKAEPLFSWPYEIHSALFPLQLLAQDLLAVERFFQSIGGIIGYHEKVLELSKEKKEKEANIRFFKPEMIDIRQETPEVKEKISSGLLHLPECAAIFPVGGVGDRLGLADPETKEALPTAMLPFLGRSLFEGLIQDLSSLEYLYQQTFGKEIFIPIVVMTSQEKKNHERIVLLCEANGWFGRPKESFCFIRQISVPVLTKKGEWVIPAPLQLCWKPGGHGMLWKLMHDEKVFEWLFSLGKTKAFIRQINNPVAGIDHGLLALIGMGASEKKSFGFAACPRRVHAAEGVNVFREKRAKDGYAYGYSNIEYTDFEKWNIQDVAAPGSFFSEYPSNTNLLYVDLQEALQVIEKEPFVGMMLNMKSKFSTMQAGGSFVEETGGRLELMMQGIADFMAVLSPLPITFQDPKKLKTFVLFNDRKKTISTTKRLFENEASFMETPEGCFYDLLQNHYELLTTKCHMELPPLATDRDFFTHGPSFLTHLHPALGPLYSVIQKKILGGRLCYGAELWLEIADLFMENVEIDGSLIIRVVGAEKKSFSGKCFLKNVHVVNGGVDTQKQNVYWKNQIERKESLCIFLHQGSEFVAENMLFEKDQKIEVPPKSRMIAAMKNGKPVFHLEQVQIL